MPLPAVEQVFAVNAAAFLAGIDAMLERTDKLTESLDAAAAAADRLSGVFDAAAAADERLAGVEEAVTSQTELLLKALEDMSAIMDEGAYAAQRTAAALDKMGASAFRAGESASVAGDRAAAAQDRAALAATRAGDAAAVAGDRTAAAGEKAALFGGHMKTALLGVGLGLAYGIAKAAKFQEQVARLYTAAGLTGAGMKQVSAQILKVGDATGYTGTQIAEALYHPVSAGLSLKASLAAVTYGAQLAQVHGASLDDTMYALSSVMKSFSIDAGGAGKTAALLNSIVGQGDMRFQDFNQSIKNWAPTAASMGISIQSMGAGIAYLTDRGNSAEVAATRLTMGLSMVTSGSKQANTILRSLGLTAGSVSLRNESLATVMNKAGLTTNRIASDLKKPDGLYVALSDLQGAFHKSGLSASQADQVMAKLFGGGRSDKAILALMQNLDGLKQKYQAIGTGVKDYGNSWAKTQETTAFKWKQAVADAQNLAITFGAVLLPAVMRVLGVLNRFMSALQQHPVLAAFAGAILAIGVAFKVVSLGAAAFSIEMEALPVFLVIAAIVALAVGLYELYRHFKIVRDVVADVGKFFTGAWHLAMEGAGAVIKWFTAGPLAFIKQQLAVFSAFWAQHGAQIKQIAGAVWGVVRDIITTAWKMVWDGTIRPGLAILKAAWNLAWGLIRDTVLLVWRMIAVDVRTAVKIVLDVISLALDLITGKWGAAWNDLKKLASDALHGAIAVIMTMVSGFGRLLWDAGVNLVEGLINGAKSMIGSVGHVIGDIGHGVVSAFKSALGIFSPSKVFYFLGSMITQGLASGITETMGQAAAKARALAAAVKDAYADKQITQAEEESYLARISNAIAAKHDKLVTAMKKLGLEMGAGMLASLENATSASTAKTAVNKLISYVKQAWSAGDISTAKASSMTKWLEADSTRLQGLATRRQKLLATIKAANAYAATTTSNTESWAGLSSVASSTASGGMTYSGNLLAGMQANLTAIRQFGAAIKKLAHMGLRKDLLNQIIQMGPAQGLQVANALIDGPAKVIGEMNATQAQIVSGSTKLGQAAANAMYDTGKSAGKGFLSGLKAQESHITAMMDRAAVSMVKTMRRELGLGGSGSGGSRGSVTVNVHGFIGSERELVAELYKAIQEEALRHNRRNGTNGLSL